MSKILVLHGPNLNLLGTREPANHGTDMLANINQRVLTFAESAGFALEAFRQRSYLSDVAVGVITGLGEAGYEYAVEAAIRRLRGSTRIHP